MQKRFKGNTAKSHTQSYRNAHRYYRLFFVFLLFITIAVLVSAISNKNFFNLVSFAQVNTSALKNGPIAGGVTDTSAVIWIRYVATSGSVPNLVLQASLSNANVKVFNQPTGAIVNASFVSASSDMTYKANLSSLLPDTTYYYNIFVDGQAVFTANYPRFKTFAPKGQATGFKIGLLSDFGTNNSMQPPLSTPVNTFSMLAQEKNQPDFIFIGGDLWHNNVYEETQIASTFKEKTRKYFRNMYSLNSPLGYFNDFVTKILPKYPLVHHFDDHDIGKNNANKNFPLKRESLEVLNEYFPTYPMTQYGDWQSFSYGKADFFVLDVRSQRDSVGDANTSAKSMLDGDNLGSIGQLQWLTNGLKNSTATWKFIFSGVPFNKTMVKNDAWKGYPNERDYLVNFIKSNNIKGVVFISGDVHFGALDDGTNADFPEMIVPPPNQRKCMTTSAPGKWSHGYYGTATLGGPPCNGYATIGVLLNPDRLIMKVNDQNGNQKLYMKYFINPADAANVPNGAE